MKSLVMILAVFAVVLGLSKVMATKAFANDRVDSAVVCAEDSDPNEPVEDAAE
jgi:hypothetical protein